MNNTVVLPGADAAVLRIGDTGRGEMSSRGIAASTDCNGRYCYLDPFVGAQIALAEGARNLACVGAAPAAITDCLNFGNPDKPEVFWTFHEAVVGLAEACRFFGVPVISGNVSLYNESFGHAIYPTPTIGIVGLVDDVNTVATAAFKQAGDTVILVGETADELGGSEYLKLEHGLVSGDAPELDLELERDVQAVVRTAVRSGLLQSAHDCSEGGLAVALAECCMAGGIGAEVVLDDGFGAPNAVADLSAVVDPSAVAALAPVAALFSETQSRILVSVADADIERFIDSLIAADVPYSVIGQTGSDELSITLNDSERIAVPVSDLSTLYHDALAQAVKG
jgi:phosphoribosylformylglycinamidine synthase